jgi:hypothetical protein
MVNAAMKGLAKLVMAAAMALASPQAAVAQDLPGAPHKQYSDKREDYNLPLKDYFSFGAEMQIKSSKLKPGSVSDKVKEESENPTFTSPYTGNTWSGDEIGSYDPTQKEDLWDVGLYAKYVPGLDFPVVPYFKLTLKYSFGPVADGAFGVHDHNFFTSTPSESISYYMDTERRVFPLEPEIGANINLASFVLAEGYPMNVGLFAGASYESVEWRYYKCWDGAGSEGRELFSKFHSNVVNFKLGFQGTGKLFDIMIGAIITQGDEEGFGGYMSAGFSF